MYWKRLISNYGGDNMEQLQEQNKKIQEYRRKVLEKTGTPRELAEAWGIS